ncbi:MAG: DMT family transporter [Rhodospirillales bacterium]|nr:MAG: DMT family transporter [Rhodospirillales bacterium]
MLWMAASGALFTFLNTIMKWLTHDGLDPWLVGFLRYLFGFLVFVPMMFRIGLARSMTRAPGLQALRAVFHCGGLLLWFYALPMVTMTEMTAMSFTGPIFMCLGAVLVLGERMSLARWGAVLMGFVGVIIVLHPWSGVELSGMSVGNAVMLLAAPVFAASFITAKVLTRHDSTEIVVLWQHLLVAVFSLPFALFVWKWPTLEQWLWFIVCGVLGAGGHYCVTRALKATDVSVIQPVRFLDLLWASLGGFLVFSAVPESWTLIGGAVIFSATLWLARHEALLARARRNAAAAPPAAKPAE